MLQVRLHFQMCAKAIPPLPLLVTLPQQLDTLLSSNRRQQHIVGGDMDCVADQLGASAVDIERRK